MTPKGSKKLLLFGGTTEAARVAAGVVARFGHRVDMTTSLAGRLSPRRSLPGRLRVGPFANATMIADILRREAFDAVIDATHPFAALISRQVAEACKATGTPRAMLLRPPWPRRLGDLWQDVRDFDAAARALAMMSARRVFLAIGHAGVPAFSPLIRTWFLVRVFATPATPFPLTNHHLIAERPPFSVEGERVLFERHRIDGLVVKQSGGPTDAKLAAARQLALPVLMVRRPPPPPGHMVDSVDGALDWLTEQLG